MIEYPFSFEKLAVWQMARKLAQLIYKLSIGFPEREKFNLESQIKRAAISILNNIAEGTGRMSNKEQARFTEMAYASLMEVLTYAILAKDLQFFTAEDLAIVRKEISTLSIKLSNFRKSQLTRHH